MNGIKNELSKGEGVFIICKNLKEWQFFQKTHGSQKKNHVEGVDPTPQVLNKTGPWVP